MRRTLVRQRARAVDNPYSTTVPTLDWDNPDEAELHGCSLLPDGGTENTAGRDQVLNEATLRVRGRADLGPLDRVRDGTTVYQVNGPVQFMPGHRPHTITRLREVKG